MHVWNSLTDGAFGDIEEIFMTPIFRRTIEAGLGRVWHVICASGSSRIARSIAHNVNGFKPEIMFCS